MSTLSMSPPLRSRTPRGNIKDQFWLKTLKWHLYKKLFGSADWETRYIFDHRVRQLNADDIVIDCGANMGEFSQKLAINGSTVHAFEPDPYSFSRLLQNTAHLPSVVCHNKAVGVGNATVKLFRTATFDVNPEAASISSSLFSSKLNVDASKFVEVEQVDLVQFIRSLPKKIRILKMDIEGSEVDVLEHMIKTGTLSCCDTTFAETHEDRIPALADRTALLRAQAAHNFSGRLYLDWH